MTITFIDSGVLITASRGVENLSERAITILSSADRELASSEFIKLELLPKAIYYRQNDEIEFYQTFFNAVTYWANDIEQIIEEGYNIACKYGLAAMDALHIAAATCSYFFPRNDEKGARVSSLEFDEFIRPLPTSEFNSN